MTQSSHTSTPNKTVSQGKLEKMVCVGAFAGAHGVRGRVRIKAFTVDPMTIGDFEYLYL